MVILTCMVSPRSHELQQKLSKNVAPGFPESHRTYARLFTQYNQTARHKYLIGQKLADIREEVLCAIFLDLHKAYDDLERDTFLSILEG